tara:strand:+ start:2709 stop:3722 length:1014 start_codon:yes stop_codon:yes gene_type:complete
MSQFNSPFVPPSLPGMGTPEYTPGAPGQLRQTGVRAQDGSLYTSQDTLNMAQGQQGFVDLGTMFNQAQQGQQQIIDQSNQFRTDLMEQFSPGFETSMSVLSDQAQGIGLTDIGAAKEESINYLKEGIQGSKDAIQTGEAKALDAIESGMDASRDSLKKSRAGAMAAQAINAGRQAGEQSNQIAAQMSASGASPAQIVSAQMDADRDRSAAAAANISQTGAQYDQAIAGTFQTQAQLEAGTIQNFTQMFSDASMQGGMALNQANQVYTQMETAQDALSQQAATALANASATGSQAMISIIQAFPPAALDMLGLTSNLFAVAQTIHAAGYNTGMNPPTS